MDTKLTPLMLDAETRRTAIRAKVIEGITEAYPVVSRNKTLEIKDVSIEEKTYSPSQQKMAILRGDSLFEPVKGTVTMRDKNGKIIDQMKNFTLARIPWYTPRHTLIVGGNEYSISNQVRPKPGVYARKRANGVLEANFNTRGGKNFNVILDAEKGIPALEYGTSTIPLYPILRESGLTHEQISTAWGKPLADKNQELLAKSADKVIDKLYTKVIPDFHRTAALDSKGKIDAVFASYGKSQLDPYITEKTLGTKYTHVTNHSLLDASKKVITIFKNTGETDDRDNLDFKTMYGIEDFFKEVIGLNARDIGRKTAIKMESTPELKKAMAPGPFTAGILKFINSSQLAAIPTQTNPMELIDASMRVTAMGEGGIGSERAIPMEARQVHATQIGALDPFRTPESFRAGIDVRAAMGVKKDAAGNIHVPLIDARTKKVVYVRAGVLKTAIVAFPDQQLTGNVDALVNGELQSVPASKVQYQLPNPAMSYSPTTNLVPFMNSLQGNRVVMGSKMQTQALSLIDREAPYVQTKSPTGHSFEHHMATLLNPQSQVSGTIKKIDGDFIYIQPDHNKTAAAAELVKVPYETYFPLAAKTYLHHDLQVKVGDKVSVGQTLADSNFTRDGKLALGKNLSVAYMPYYGANSNDAIVISEGAAKKLTSSRMYKMVIPIDPDVVLSKNQHQSYFGHAYTSHQYAQLDKNGVVLPGTRVMPTDPIFLGLRKSQASSDDLILGRLHKSLAKPYREFAEKWTHDHAGIVVDVVPMPKRIAITIRTEEPMVVGDKMAGRAGNKGVVAQIVPDTQMIQDESGKPIDVLMTSAGIVSRTNPGILLETALGKVVEKTGKPILVEGITGSRDNVAWAKGLLKEHGIKDKETVYDPIANKQIPNVFVGRQYILKLMKSTDTNYSARSTGSYDVNQQPTKGGATSSKAIGKMEFDALIAHNARNVLREASTIKSQKNDEFWKAVQLGYPTPPPKTAFAYDKFLNMLTAAGVRSTRNNSKLSLSPLSDADVESMSSGEILNPTIVRAKDLKPEEGGLFDIAKTGGLNGTRWTHIQLVEPIVNPTFREPVRRLLSMTEAQLTSVLASGGGEEVKKLLKEIDLDKKEAELFALTKTRKADGLDDVVKQLKYIRALRKLKMTPDQAYIVTKVPVLPPVYRPIIPGQGGQQILYGDLNPLYRDLLFVNAQAKEAKASKLLPDEIKKVRVTLNAAVGAVYGMDDPITAKSRARGHKGVFTYIAGVTSPKEGYFQSKLMKRTQDVAGRGTIVPDSTLGMDQVGIPEDMLWTMYEKFLIKDLVSRGFPAIEAAKLVKDKHPTARESLLKETQNRPLMINRAPTLHRGSLIGAYPLPVPGKTIRINPFAEVLTNSDYDGDTMMIHVPIGDKAVDEVRGMTLSNLLFGDQRKKDLMVFPQHEAIMGLAYASTQDEKNKPVHFKNKAEAMAAYTAGKITLGTNVVIGADSAK